MNVLTSAKTAAMASSVRTPLASRLERKCRRFMQSWSGRMGSRRHARLASLENDELARSFNIAPQMISELSQYNLLTVYHDNIGRIIDLKAEPPQNRG